MILCNKNLKTDRISHLRETGSPTKDYNSHDQNKEIGNNLCIFVGNDSELSQCLNLQIWIFCSNKQFLTIYIDDRYLFFGTHLIDLNFDTNINPKVPVFDINLNWYLPLVYKWGWVG